jgi:hypothetical protein
MEKFCSNCGTEVIGPFCSKCGNKTSFSNPEGPATPNLKKPEATGLSIASFIMSFLFSPAGLIMGIIAKNEISNSRGEKGGEGLALAAIIISSVIIAIWILVIAAVIYGSSLGFY